MSSTLIAEIIMNEFDWSNIAVMVKEKQFPQTNFDVLLVEFKKFLLHAFIFVLLVFKIKDYPKNFKTPAPTNNSKI